MPILIATTIVVVIIILAIYNSLVKSENKVNQAESNIDVYLNQRFDLIPNLVECVKSYSKYEQSVLSEIARLRTEYLSKNKNIKSAEVLNNKMNELIAVAEDNPNLKASNQYLKLQKTLEKLESQLQAARRIYNIEVTNYNNKIETVPSNIIAGLFGFKKADLFEIEEYKKENIDVNI